MTKRITKSTIKSFIKKNADNLYIQKKSSYDGMCDGWSDRAAHPFQRASIGTHSNQLGIEGAWFTTTGNIFHEYNDGVYIGYNVYNCCGEFNIAIKIQLQIAQG